LVLGQIGRKAGIDLRTDLSDAASCFLQERRGIASDFPKTIDDSPDVFDDYFSEFYLFRGFMKIGIKRPVLSEKSDLCIGRFRQVGDFSETAQFQLTVFNAQKVDGRINAVKSVLGNSLIIESRQSVFLGLVQ